MTYNSAMPFLVPVSMSLHFVQLQFRTSPQEVGMSFGSVPAGTLTAIYVSIV